MFACLEEILTGFRECFRRPEAYRWFIVLTVGFILREDKTGITSVVRALLLDSSCYETMLHFFYSTAWDLDVLRKKWCKIVSGSGLVFKVRGKYILAGDGVKQAKEAFFMPGVKKLFQESEDSSKAKYIFGHMFGAIGAVIANGADTFCIPLQMSIQEGLSEAASWGMQGSPSGESHVLQVVRNGYRSAAAMGGAAILLLDRYFLTVPALRLMDQLNSSEGGRMLDIITKAKRGCKAYEKPPATGTGKRGRPRKKGDAVHLWDYFEDRDIFRKSSVNIYGKAETVSYLSLDLLWGKGLYHEVRFVLVIRGESKSILVSTDIALSPEQIIELYARRFRIEHLFREFKQQIGGFCYHFWTHSINRLNHFKKKSDPDPLEMITDTQKRQKILYKIRAIECFVHLCCIALGTIQMMSLKGKHDTELGKFRYLRTVRRSTPSEATIKEFLHRNLLTLLAMHPSSPITEIIRTAQKWNQQSKAG